MDVSWAQGAAAVVAVGSAALLGGMASRIVGAWRRRIRHRAAVVEGSAALQAVWELDLWGKYRNSTAAAREQLLATEAGQRGVLLSLAVNGMPKPE